ncbi:hypothetical protein [Laribacter hongkongensis]|uniref:hypothetical protein n=1 Tax=Laribacter hongkongensis TaxID=168471 RepID=UPI001EFE7AAE|nr:hypothetical protein [Laribacter hongkongensis]MCG9094440.1 hypothetical protein [Laribacter hongkongensis]
MQCNCKQEFEKKFLQRLKKENPESTDHRVELGGYAFILEEGINELPALEINASHVVTAKNGNKRQKKIKSKFICKYCPLCGMQAKPDKKTSQTN